MQSFEGYRDYMIWADIMMHEKVLAQLVVGLFGRGWSKWGSERVILCIRMRHESGHPASHPRHGWLSMGQNQP